MEKSYTRQKRKELDLNFSQMACKSGIPLSTYKRIDMGFDLLQTQYRYIEGLAQAFGLTVEELIKNDAEFKENEEAD